MFNKEQINAIIDDLQTLSGKIKKLQTRMFALEDLLNVAYVPEVSTVTYTNIGESMTRTDREYEPEHFVFVNRFPEKVKKNKEKKVITKKKK